MEKGLVFGEETIEVAVDVFMDQNDRRELSTSVEFSYDKSLTLEHIENKAIEMAKEKLKKISNEI
ncbi:hypothetical protein FE394_16715 [Xenorhabdus sp. Reich]|uniref:Uncharacterized protein n=2 Tax=Xenorhabdus littoralis TaxID=2582835 RepID=A0ABU4SQE1_9GAMM|nr:hypothetical protein [Xenorhabdus sp. Reich]